MKQVGLSMKRVDAYDKATGRTLYGGDRVPQNALVAKIVHSTIAHGMVKHIDTTEAERIPGVVKIVTCFDVPDIQFPTAGHPWSLDPSHRDPADRKLLNAHVRYYGDDVAVVIAEDEVAAVQGMRAVKIEYEEYPFVLDVQEAIGKTEHPIHDEHPDNVLAHSGIHNEHFEEAIQEPGLVKVDGWYNSPMVQHCHIEPHICFAYMENGRITIVSSTQIPHVCRRICGQALGIPWGNIHMIKAYVGGGFGNKQDALYEPLCCFLTTQVGGRCVKLDCTREETFINNRVRHPIRSHITSWVRPDGTFAARRLEAYSDQGAYGSHGHSIVAKGMGCFPQLYPCDIVEAESYTVYTNKPTGGAMRGYGIPQAMWAVECHTDDVARAIGMEPVEFRRKNLMKKGFYHEFSKNELYFDTFNECMDKAIAYIDYYGKLKKYQNQTGPVRRGIGCSVFWYNTAVYPISLETSSCRMVLHPGGRIVFQCGETEIGQGADTVQAQMVADAVGVLASDVTVESCQDTDITPFGTGVYASRGTYVAGFSIRQTGEIFRKKILDVASKMTRMPAYNLDLEDGKITRNTDGRYMLSLADVAEYAQYTTDGSQHITAESTYQIRSNAFSFGCTFAEVEVDIPLCKAKLIDIVNVHDAGKLINPALAEAQVHGGMSMAIGMGLTEEMLFDQRTGKPLNDNLLDYKLSTFMDHPHLEAEFVENYEPTSAFGAKALGEPPTCSPAPAIRNAILQATGVAVNDAPVNPHRMFDAFTEAGLI
ncbi:MAG: xanthine dehydrogenase subunit XdhA [Oscillospiraceae bacterium]|nr:xanthine dehydrogenase subunit XdhA [Oscillospiraceae bacterium]